MSLHKTFERPCQATIQGVSPHRCVFFFNWALFHKTPGQSNIPEWLQAEKWPRLQREAKTCLDNHHCHPIVAILAQVVMHSWHVPDSKGSGKSPTVAETQTNLVSSGRGVQSVRDSQQNGQVRLAMRRWCQKLKVGLRVELPIAKEAADGHAGQKALSFGTLAMSLGITRTTFWRLLREQRGRPYKRVSLTVMSGAPASQGEVPHFPEAPSLGAPHQTCSSQTRSCFGSGLRGTRRTTLCGGAVRRNG